jgi:hypothetical protein
MRARVPVRIEVLTLLVEVDATVARWTPAEKGGTVGRLHALVERSWRPQDASVLKSHCDDLRRWVIEGTKLLDPPPQVYLPGMACPRCGVKVAYRGVERTRGWALRVTENGAVCGACGGFWPPSEFHWLARLLGC